MNLAGIGTDGTASGDHAGNPRQLLPRLAILLACLGLAAACSEDRPGTIAGVFDSGQSLPMDGFLDDTVPLFDTASVTDVAPLPGKFGAPCDETTDCDSGICVESADGKICSQQCIDTCAKGFACVQQTALGSDNSWVCLPRFLHVCDPCAENKDCNGTGEKDNVCVNFGADGSFCGAKCSTLHPDCPPGYDCQDHTDPASGAAIKQCLPSDGMCKCSKNAQTLALKTSCLKKNLTGTCPGWRQCSTGGLSDCSAPVPKAEECNGLDDDCDGQTDNFKAGNAKCSGDANEFGACPGIVKDCVDGKALCEAPVAQPETCNQKDDNCDGVTDNVPECDDKDSCTNDTCDAAGCQHKPLSGVACDDGSICTQTDKCLAGKCTGGNALKCDDQDPCTADACDPFTGCTHDPASDAVCTSDGNACTQDICQNGACVHPLVSDGSACADDGKACTADTCQNGLCKHTPADGLKCTEDGNVCTDDICKAGGCIHVYNIAACEDGDQCTDNDKCSGGKCLAGKKNLCNDNNPCTKDLCDKSAGCYHDNNDFAACTSGSGDCPVGQCAGGNCQSKPNVTCKTEVDTDLCGSADVAGVCTASGQCVPTKEGNPACTIPCAGLCVKCFGIQLCIPI